MTEPAAGPAVPRRRFLYLRHGRTDWNLRGIAQGAVDVPLDETGIAQARAAAAVLARAGGGIDRVVCSPLDRAARTAEIVRAALAAASGAEPPPLARDDGLREAAFGPYEGQPLGAWLDRWMAGGAGLRDGIEPFAALSARVTRAVAARLARSGTDTVLFVAHGAVFRALRAGLGMGVGERVPNALPLEIAPEPDGAAGWRIGELGPTPPA